MYSTLPEMMNKIRVKLQDYLEENGVSINSHGFMRCINPEHADRTPSCSIGGKRGGSSLHCFGCGSSYDIFDACNIIENRPLFGVGFIKENVLYLADKYHIDCSHIKIEDYDIVESQFYTLTSIAARYILNAPFSAKAEEFLLTRGIPVEKCRGLDIGFIDDYDKYIAKITEGNPEILGIAKQAGLDDRRLFSPNNLFFIIRNSNNRPVGFAARNLLYSKTADSIKFVNQSCAHSSNIYKKGSRLYGLSYNTPDDKPLYIFEGYLDRAIGALHGVKCAAIGGTSFTNEHIETLSKAKHKDIVLIYDGDMRGSESTYKVIDKLLEEPTNLNIKLGFLPEGYDPDTFILEKGTDALYDLPKLSPFEWRLESLQNDKEKSTSPEQICQTMVPYVGLFANHLQRLELLRNLSFSTGIDIADLKIELDNYLNIKDRDIGKEIISMLDKTRKDILKTPSQSVILLQNTISNIEQIQSKSSNSIYNLNEYNLLIEDLIKTENAMDSEKAPGYKYGVFKQTQEALEGQMTGKLILLAGSANTGKTHWISNMLLQIANCNEDVVPFFHTLDDGWQDIHYRLLSILGTNFYNKTTINKMQYTNYYISRGETELKMARAKAYELLMGFLEDQKIFMKDAGHGRDSGYTETMIKRIQDQTGKNVFAFIDNIHNLKDFIFMQGDDRYKAIADNLKRICQDTGCTLLGTVEYRKGADKVFENGLVNNANELIAETRAFDYNANVIMHLYNEMHYNSKSDKFHTVEWTDDKYPICQLQFSKNKISSFKGFINLDLYPPSAVYQESSRVH